ncbi:hypothetical protein SteCoe_13163 [Stentor coeruleus]|uniref:Rab-GAP TBC domain-containing protein n=1 Tax=Stentor coeruleus TaxID=5963 RepID=A0A1R2C8Y5_9CILI|nr:hypothetical protein SteCoe_13163 [Stentor coeruleus]
MGLACQTMYRDDTKKSTYITKNDSWVRTAGFLFKPGFYKEIDESTYEIHQFQYHILWRRIQGTLKKRSSIAGEGLFNRDLYHQWKQYIRAGVPDSMSRDVILKLFQIIPDDTYWKIIKENFEGMIPEHFLTVPTFSSVERIDIAVPKFYINSAGLIALKRILWALYKVYDTIKYCPQLPTLISILLIYLNEEEVFLLCCKLIENTETTYLIQDKNVCKEFIANAAAISIREEPKLIELFSVKDIEKTIWDMIIKLFIGYFRVSCVLKILMTFLVEGIIVLEKFISQVFVEVCNDKTGNGLGLKGRVKSYTMSLDSCHVLMKKAFRVRVSNDEEPDPSTPRNLKNSCLNLSMLISEAYMQEIINNIDPIYANHGTRVIYTSNTPKFHDIISASSTFPMNISMLCVFLTLSYEICGFFSEQALHCNVNNPEQNCLIFFLEPEIKFFKASRKTCLKVSKKGIKIGRKVPVLVVDKNLVLTWSKTEEFGDCNAFGGNMNVQVCELIAFI